MAVNGCLIERGRRLPAGAGGPGDGDSERTQEEELPYCKLSDLSFVGNRISKAYFRVCR
jgi:hypothetical protein